MGMFIHFRWLFIIFALLYFIAAIVARKKRSSSGIFWLNFFLGWTVVGWVTALIWALKKDPQSTQVVDHGAQEWVRCAGCGKYSPPGAKCCSSCGAQITTGFPSSGEYRGPFWTKSCWV